MSLFKRGRLWWTRVKPTPTHPGVRISTATTDHKLGKQMERFADLLRDKHQWAIAHAIGMGEITLPEAFDLWAKDPTFKTLWSQLSKGDVVWDLDDWEQWALGHAVPRTVDQYRKQIEWLGNPDVVQLTRRYFADQLAALGDDVTSTTKRNYLTAWSSFCQYLVEQEQLDFNPCHNLRWPTPNVARERWMLEDKSLQLIDALEPKWRVAAALAEGAGVEWAGLERGHWEDVLAPDGTLFHAHGTKKPWRDRIVKVDWPFSRYVAEWAPSGDGNPPVVPGTYWQFTQAHRAAVAAIGEEDYTLHDARHSYAVRHMQANAPIMDIAQNLGHKDATLVLKVYGKYRPR